MELTINLLVANARSVSPLETSCMFTSRRRNTSLQRRYRYPCSSLMYLFVDQCKRAIQLDLVRDMPFVDTISRRLRCKHPPHNLLNSCVQTRVVECHVWTKVGSKRTILKRMLPL